MIKVAFVGNGAVGKTSIIGRYVNGLFNPDHIASIGSDFEVKKIVVDGLSYDVQIWDTAGQEVYHSITPVYIQNSQILMLCFDPTNQNTSWEAQVQPWLDIIAKRKQTWMLFLVATKCDVYGEHELDANLLAALKQKTKARDVYITSAKTGTNIEDLFEGSLRSYLREPLEMDKGLHLDDEKKQKQACC